MRSINNRPDTIVLTFPKTGSTSLHHTFSKHPDICLSNSKETWFFDQFWDQGIQWYEDKFSHCSGTKIRCDFASTLMYKEGFTAKLKQAVPEAKFIVLLRDPVKRCFSHYFHEVRRGLEIEDFDTALAKEKDRIKAAPQNYSHIAYKDIGSLYGARLNELIEKFDTKRIHFVLLEEITSFPDILKGIYDFIGVSHLEEDFSHENVARLPRNRLAEKISNIPQHLFYKIQTLLFMQSLVPKTIKHKTRRMRNKIANSLSYIAELSYKKTDGPEISEETYAELVAYYNENLKGLDLLIKKDLKTYWPWYSGDVQR